MNLLGEGENIMFARLVLLASVSLTCVHLGAQCTFAVTPNHLNFEAAGQVKSVRVVASSSTCVVPGTLGSNSAWLKSTTGSKTDNVSIFGFQADPNTGSARSATITLAGQSVPAFQAAGTTVPANTSPTITAAGMMNGGSFQSGAIAPGEILSVFGKNLGPDTVVQLQIGADHMTVSQVLAGTIVFFDNEPAPVLFTSSNQVNVIVPYSVAKKAVVNVRVEFGSAPSNQVSLPLAQTSPAFFSANGSGNGQGAFLNKDGTVNSTTNPAHPGDTLILYGTGGGLSSPSLPVEQLVPSAEPLPRLTLPVQVSVGGKPATVLYAGGAPRFVSGLVQINVVIPSNVTTGDAVPVTWTVGSATSSATVTAAIR